MDVCLSFEFWFKVYIRLFECIAYTEIQLQVKIQINSDQEKCHNDLMNRSIDYRIFHLLLITYLIIKSKVTAFVTTLSRNKNYQLRPNVEHISLVISQAYDPPQLA